MDNAQSILAKIRRPRVAVADGIVLFLLFAGINFSMNSSQPGWFAVNPNPYLLLPVLMGGRYGTPAGLYSAAVAVGLLVGFAWYADPYLDPELFLRGESVLFVSFFLFGLVAGEVQSFFRRKASRMDLLLQHSSDKMKVLDRDIRNIARVNRELQERLLVSDNRTFAMDLEIRALYECRVDELWKKALLVLNRTEEIACAAFYDLPSHGVMERKAVIGGDSRLPDSLPLDSSLLIQEALRQGEMMVLSDLLAPDQAEEEPFLFAKPIDSENAGRFGILVVSRMPFLRFDPHSLARIDLTVDWIAEILELRMADTDEHEIIKGTENKRLLTENHFRRMVSLSVSAWRELRVPSGIICIRAADVPREELVETVNRRVRAGDFICQIQGENPNVVVLLPFTSERGTEIFIGSCRTMIEKELPDRTVTLDHLSEDKLGSDSLVWAEIEEMINERLG